MKTTIAILTALALTAPLYAQCANGQCRPPIFPQPTYYPAPTIPSVITPTAPVAPEPITWKTWDQDPGRSYLYRGNVQIGAYDFEQHYFRSYDPSTQKWGEIVRPPIAPPCFGVVPSKVSATPRYQLNGQDITKEDAHGIMANGLAANGFDDDSAKLRVTVTAPDPARRKQIVSDVKQSPDAPSFAIRDYDPKSWELSCGFKTDGDPTVYCQAPSGKVLHRQDDYQGGPDALIGALRKAKASYDPKRDPDLRKGDTITPLAVNLFPFAIAAGIALIIVNAAPYAERILHATH